MRASHRLIRLEPWGHNGCAGHRPLQELIFWISVHQSASFTHRGKWHRPENWVAGYTVS